MFVEKYIYIYIALRHLCERAPCVRMSDFNFPTINMQGTKYGGDTAVPVTVATLPHRSQFCRTGREQAGIRKRKPKCK